MLDRELKELKELRSLLKVAPKKEAKRKPFKGLRIVSMPKKGDSDSKQYKSKQKQRENRAEQKRNNTLACKLQGFKVAA